MRVSLPEEGAAPERSPLFLCISMRRVSAHFRRRSARFCANPPPHDAPHCQALPAFPLRFDTKRFLAVSMHLSAGLCCSPAVLCPAVSVLIYAASQTLVSFPLRRRDARSPPRHAAFQRPGHSLLTLPNLLAANRRERIIAYPSQGRRRRGGQSRRLGGTASPLPPPRRSGPCRSCATGRGPGAGRSQATRGRSQRPPGS